MWACATVAPSEIEMELPVPKTGAAQQSVPLSSPTRTPIVAVSLVIARITCNDFDATVFTLALDSIMKNATFSDPTCSDASSDWALASDDVSVPLVMAAAAGMAVHEVSAMERSFVCEYGMVPKKRAPPLVTPKRQPPCTLRTYNVVVSGQFSSLRGRETA